MSGGTKFLSVLTILIFLQLSDTPFAEQNQRCAPSSCGHIKNISYPFRLKTDPKHCGDEKYEMSCEGNRPVFTLFMEMNASLNYYVQTINYDNSTIRLVDPGIREQVICSLPQHSITFYTLPRQFGFTKPDGSYASLAVPITIFSCPFAMNSPAFLEITNCLNRSDASKGHAYAARGKLSPSNLRVGCSVNLMLMTSWPTIDDANVSILELHNALAYGFELSWFRDIYCNKCGSIYSCEGENSRNVRCLPGPNWRRKSEIALGVARGIEYLHRGCDIQILHFDIKPHNILLDENFVPKISDFGLAKLYPTDNSIVTLTAARGTIGYVAPELINRSIGPISYKADVYSFGMLLIEMAGMKSNSAAREDMSSQYFPHWIYDQFDKEKEIQVLDETHDDEKKIIKKLTLVALWCIQMNPLVRPSMTKVVEMLEGELQALQTPPRPSQSLQPSPLEFNLSSSFGSTESMSLLQNCSDSAKVDVIIG